MSQTSYSVNQLVAFAGLLADIGPHDIGTYVWSGSAALPFGVGVTQDTADNHIKLPAASGDVTSALFAGVTVGTQTVENVPVGLGSYKQYAAVSVLKKGRIWVQVEEAVTTASPVFVRFASGAGGTQLGSFRASADTATAVALPTAKYLSSAAAAGFAVLEINVI